MLEGFILSFPAPRNILPAARMAVGIALGLGAVPHSVTTLLRGIKMFEVLGTYWNMITSSASSGDFQRDFLLFVPSLQTKK